MSNTLDNNLPDCDSTSDPDEPEPSGPAIEISIDDTVRCDVPIDRLIKAARAASRIRGFSSGEIGIRVTDDPTIRQLNAKHLNHDHETDVISFAYECHGESISGELVVSTDTAARRATELGWMVAGELLLYVVHGVLHITGMDDQTPQQRQQMRQVEQQVMLGLGVDDIVKFGADTPRERPSGSSEASG